MNLIEQQGVLPTLRMSLAFLYAYSLMFTISASQTFVPTTEANTYK